LDCVVHCIEYCAVRFADESAFVIRAFSPVNICSASDSALRSKFMALKFNSLPFQYLGSFTIFICRKVLVTLDIFSKSPADRVFPISSKVRVFNFLIFFSHFGKSSIPSNSPFFCLSSEKWAQNTVKYFP
jgi:hypothetical protein